MGLYGKIYRDILWPAYERMRGRQTRPLFQQAEQNQWISPEALRQFQWGELQSLLRHAFGQSPWYREHLRKHGLTPDEIRSPVDFCQVPPITKEDIRQHREQMLAANYRGRVYEHKTGGSTGSPLQFFVNRRSYEWRVAVSMRGYHWAGCQDGDRHFYVWGAPIGTPPLRQRVKVRLHNASVRRRIFSSFGFSESAMGECARQIAAFRPKTIIGYTNALYLLAQHILDHKLRVGRPEAIITAAEGVNQLQRQTIEQAFESTVFASYGSREFMLLAMECEQHNGLHVSTDNVYLEVVVDGRPAVEGEAGEILVTDLHNYGMPFIRYKIGDIGVTTARLCPCGRGLPLLQRVEGRVLDVIRTPDGRRVPGEFFPHLMKEFDAVRQFQVVQQKIDLLQINLVLRDGQHSDQLQRIEHEIKRVLGQSIAVNIQHVPVIAQTASGKFRVTVSELAQS